MSTTWILVAHGSAGKILELKKDETTLLKKEFSHPNTAKRGQEINSDRMGRSIQSAVPMKHAMEAGEELHDHERRVFAKEIANFLAKAHAENQFDGLILVISPNLLGDVRKALENPIKKTVKYELDKDLFSQRLTDTELLEKIRKDLGVVRI